MGVKTKRERVKPRKKVRNCGKNVCQRLVKKPKTWVQARKQGRAVLCARQAERYQGQQDNQGSWRARVAWRIRRAMVVRLLSTSARKRMAVTRGKP